MSRKIKFAVLLIIIVVSIFLLRAINKQELISPKATFSSESSLGRVVLSSLTEAKGKYGIVIKNFKTGESYSLNEHQEFEPGSLYKLWTMATVFTQTKEGILKEDKLLEGDIADLNRTFNIDPEDAELQEGFIDMTVSEALNQMITISHNYAALLLTREVKNSSITNFLNNNGFKQSRVGQPPKTTASDTALFFDKLYKGELVDKASSDKMTELLKGQQLNDGLPKLLPEGVVVAHKTGDIGWFKHDVGIVFSQKGDYIIVVLSESDSPLGAQARIAEISKAVYQYFNK